VSEDRGFHIEKHWRYYSQLTYMVRLPFFNRPITTHPWTRFPSDTWLPADDGWIIPFGFAIQIPFSLSFLLAWFFHFPTRTEHLIWQMCSVYHAAFSILGTFYYLFGATCTSGSNRKKRQQHLRPEEVVMLARSGSPSPPLDAVNGVISRDIEEGRPSPPPAEKGADKEKRFPRLAAWFESRISPWRNISPHEDPAMKVVLRWTLPTLPISFIYILCRLYFYAEDFAGLRSQPAGVYQAVNHFLPFIP